MTPQEIAQTLTSPLTESQKLKVSALQSAVERQSVLVRALQLEQRRIAALYGSQSPELKSVAALAAARQQSLAVTQSAAQRAGLRAPVPGPRQFVIYGYIRDSAGAGVPKIAVSALSEKNSVVQTATTDKDGSYLLRIGPGDAPESFDQPSMTAEREDQSGAAKSGRRATTRRAAATAGTPPTTLRLIATDKKETFRVESPTSFEFQPGKLGYQDLIVPT